jgi:hypothetical protein
MVNPEDVERLEKQIIKVSQSTRTTIPAFVKIHDRMRQIFPWYYNWHTQSLAPIIHVLILITILVLIAWWFLRVTADSLI